MLLTSGQRGQTLHLLDIRNMSLSPSRITCSIGDPLKTTRPGHHLSQLIFEAYAHDRKLCVVSTIHHYLDRTKDLRGTVTRFFLTTKPPITSASRDTLRRWTRDMMKSAGIDLNIFLPHSTRSASTSKAAGTLPLSTILSTAGWSRESTFTSHYKRPIAKQSDFARAVLP